MTAPAPRTAPRPARWLVVASAITLLTLTGCSDDAPPGEAAPALAASLEDVDAAIESEKYDDARNAVKKLIAETAQALVADEISDEEADRIFEAAREVLAELPEGEEKRDPR